MDHAVDVVLQAEEQAELGLVLDLALDGRADRMLLRELFPRIAHGLLQAERDAALGGVDFEDDHLHLLRGGDDLARMDVLLRPAHLGDVDQTLDPRLQLHEGAVVGDVGDAAGEARADRVFRLDALPRIRLELLHAERDAEGLRIDADDLHLHRLADIQDLGRVVDAPPRHVGDVKQAVDAAEIDEGAVFGDVLDDAVDHLAFVQALHQLGALLRERVLKHRAARDDDVAAPLVHLQDTERLRRIHQRADVAHRAHVHLAPRQEGHGAVEIDGEAALHLVEYLAGDGLVLLEALFEPDPALLAARLLAAEHRFAERVLDALKVDFDLVAGLQLAVASANAEFLERYPSFDFQTDVDDGDVLLDCDDRAFDDGSLGEVALGEGLFQKSGKILPGGLHLCYLHQNS